MLNDLQPLKNGSLKEQVFHTLREAIFTGVLQPGEPLREARLSRQLQVSQSTIREALIQLEHLGLVTRVPNKHTLVTHLSREDVAERLVVRLRLEELASVEAARRADEAFFTELDDHLGHMARAWDARDDFACGFADLEFHRRIWKQAHNRTLYDMLNQLTVPLFAFVSMKRRAERPGGTLVQAHQEILQSLRAADEAAIRQALERHLDVFKSIPASLLA